MKRKLPKYDNGGKIKLKDGVQTNKVDNTRVNYTPTFSKKPFTPENWATNINEIQPDGRPNPKIPGLQDATLDAMILLDAPLALGKLATKGLSKAGVGSIKDIHKLNPYAFKPNPENFYRQIGKSGIDDLKSTKLVREAGEEVSPEKWESFQNQIKKLQGDDSLDAFEKMKQSIEAARRPASPFFSKGETFYAKNKTPKAGPDGKVIKRGYDGDASYLLETSLPNEAFQNAYVKQLSLGNPTEVGMTGILKPNPSLRQVENFKVYKQDWLQGYKEMKKYKSGGRVLPKYYAGGVYAGGVTKRTYTGNDAAGVGKAGNITNPNTFNGEMPGLNAGLSASAAIGTEAIDTFVDPNSLLDSEGNVVANVEKAGAAIGKGALKGAAAGAAIGSAVPVIGTAIGAGVGAIGGAAVGAFTNNKERNLAREDVRRANEGITTRNIMTRNLGSFIPMSTTNNNNYAAKGGLITGSPNTEIEDGELVEVPQGTKGVAHTGGKLNPLSSNSYQADGQTHDNGGIETSLPDESFVFTDQFGIGNKSFAKIVKPILREIGKIEKRMVETPGNPILESTLKRLNDRKNQYRNIQESMKPIVDPQQIQEGQTMPMFGDGGKISKTRTTNYGPSAIELAKHLSRVEGRALSDTSSHGNGAYGPYGFRQSGHLKEWYENSETFPSELKKKYLTYENLFNSYSSGKMDKTDVAKLHAQYPYFLMDKTGGNSELASIYNFGGNAGVSAYNRAVKNNTLEDFYASSPSPGNMTYGQYTGKREAPLKELVIKPKDEQRTTNWKGNPSPLMPPGNPDLSKTYVKAPQVNPNVDLPLADIPVITPDNSPLYKAKPYGMALTGVSNIIGNSVEMNRINNTAPPRRITPPTFHAGSAPTPVDNSAELAQIGADFSSGRQMLRRGTSGAGMAANLGALNAIKAQANNRVYNSANTLNATRRDAFNEREAAAINAGIEAAYKNDVMNNENMANYNLWKTGSKNAATASLSRAIGDVGNTYTDMENQLAGLDAIRKSDIANVGNRRGLTVRKLGGIVKTKRVNYGN